MNELKKWIKQIQTLWKQLVVLITWLGSVASTFILPLPDWGSENEQAAQMHFVLFISTGIAGFVYIVTLKNKNRITWLVISVSSFILSVSAYYYNDHVRENNTEEYYGQVLVIGTDLTEGAIERWEALEKMAVVEWIKLAAGDVASIWTEESIYKNKWKLILWQAITYCFVTIFIISITHTILIYATKNQT